MSDRTGGMEEKAKITVVSLGCSKNLVDSETLMGQLNGGSVTLVPTVDEADTVIINTCGFIEAAKQESIDAILEAVERKNSGKLKKVVVMGCLSERFRNELTAEIPGVDAYFGSDNIPEVLTSLGVDFRRELLGERVLTTPSHFAYLKISEGCTNPCSFCAIPLMRGFHRTKPMEHILAEARLLAERGVKELIVIGQDTTYYGLERYGERRLYHLLAALNQIEGIEWIRLMYAYPAKFPTDLINAFADLPKLCKYIDIPVQHAADEVLRSMRRGITGRGQRDLLHRISAAHPEMALRTTVIVGYPNETDEDFRTLCEFVKEIRFHRLGVFMYSQEEGTSAYDLGDPVPASVKEERRDIIMQLQQEISEERNRTLLGSRIRVLIDRAEGDELLGRTQWDAPEIDQEVVVKGATMHRPGEFFTVRISDATEYDLYADLA